ncbi:dynamin-A [Thecamonas trahens ATCC 50062]|uniref:Dynamin-A n=1 Tax=Thecamonas trahens ATCC 50062 TaxID=461836 RepID=A0A0L0DGD7_THETB|nr:dynamin-A [Thecamonas trahens ATCC 50062]KNC51397.1 dynamin-A [Thecamonas trahens ATCC 50062]|eukprot:XP_013756064.1 dynamin-A [Thecamonas trahens ATCC 50062]
MGMDDLIPVVNKLQDVLSSVGTDMIDLPQIVVVGSQSSGKSSVLENIVGRDFLPRGSGIVTRRPLILQLVQTKPAPGASSAETGDGASTSDGAPSSGSAAEGEEWAEFLHLPETKFTDFAAVRDEISSETDRATGTNKGISDAPISLKIYSPHVLNLTLVDLPGITKVPVGDQPSDIETLIRDMILHFIEKPNALILAVTAANSDLANSDALQLARRVDPDGERTLGVLTKLDLMDAGTNALEILNNEIIALKLGFVGVSIPAALEAEASFFASHPAYAPLATRLGTRYLTRQLNTLLVAHIKKCLPGLKKRISAKHSAAASEMATLGAPVSPESAGSVVLDVITKFAADFKAALDGTMADLSMLFFNAIQDIRPGEELTEEDIETLIRNATGTRGQLFMPGASFEVLVKKAVAQLKEPAMQCVNLVYEELLRLLNTYTTKELARFARLRERLHNVVSDTFAKCLKPTYAMVTNLINVELAYVNTRHPDFVVALAAMRASSGVDHYASSSTEAASSAGAAAAAVSSAAASGADPAPSGWFSKKKSKKGGSGMSPPAQLAQVRKPQHLYAEHEMSETQLIRELLDAYFTIVKKNILDGVPKSIMLFLVNNAASHVQNELVKALYHENEFGELVRESGTVAQRREVVATQIRVYKAAERILNQIRDWDV